MKRTLREGNEATQRLPSPGGGLLGWATFLLRTAIIHYTVRLAHVIICGVFVVSFFNSLFCFNLAGVVILYSSMPGNSFTLQ
jgi:hypothetical protein